MITFQSAEQKEELLKLSNELSLAIKRILGECNLWFLANTIYRDIDDAPIKHQ